MVNSALLQLWGPMLHLGEVGADCETLHDFNMCPAWPKIPSLRNFGWYLQMGDVQTG